MECNERYHRSCRNYTFLYEDRRRLCSNLFLVVEKLAVDVVQGTCVISKHVPGILPWKREVLPQHLPPVSISIGNQAKPPPSYEENQNWKDSSFESLPVAQQTEILPQTRSWVPLTLLAFGRFQLESALLGTDFPILQVTLAGSHSVDNFVILDCFFFLAKHPHRRLPKTSLSHTSQCRPCTSSTFMTSQTTLQHYLKEQTTWSLPSVTDALRPIDQMKWHGELQSSH